MCTLGCPRSSRLASQLKSFNVSPPTAGPGLLTLGWVRGAQLWLLGEEWLGDGGREATRKVLFPLIWNELGMLLLNLGKVSISLYLFHRDIHIYYSIYQNCLVSMYVESAHCSAASPATCGQQGEVTWPGTTGVISLPFPQYQLLSCSASNRKPVWLLTGPELWQKDKLRNMCYEHICALKSRDYCMCCKAWSTALHPKRVATWFLRTLKRLTSRLRFLYHFVLLMKGTASFWLLDDCCWSVGAYRWLLGHDASCSFRVTAQTQVNGFALPLTKGYKGA